MRDATGACAIQVAKEALEMLQVDLERGNVMAADDADDEGDVRPGTHTQEVDKAKNGATCLGVSRPEGDLIGKGGGVGVTVLCGRHG
jgi:hypothetical protein